MTEATQTLATVAAIAAVATAGAAVTNATAPVAEPKAPKAPSKKSQAVAIFAAKLEERKQGLFATNREFRAAVLRAIETELSVSTPSAATMYNSCKDEAEKADPTIGLGRDPKVVKVKVEGSGKRGRPAGSTNKKKEAEAVAADATATAEGTAAVEAAAPEAVAA